MSRRLSSYVVIKNLSIMVKILKLKNVALLKNSVK